MEGVLIAMIGLVGAMLGALLMWIRSDIKSINVALAEHGQRLARIEAGHGDRLARIETTLGIPASTRRHASG